MVYGEGSCQQTAPQSSAMASLVDLQQQNSIQQIPFTPYFPPEGLWALSQQNELALAKQRAEKAAAGRRQSVALRRKMKKQQQPKAADITAYQGQQQVDTIDQQYLDDEALQKAVENATDEKESKRLKRLLRNRVSAQQARERRKMYVSDLEQKTQQQEQRIVELERQVEALQAENDSLKSSLQANGTQPFDTSALANDQEPSFMGDDFMQAYDQELLGNQNFN